MQKVYISIKNFLKSNPNRDVMTKKSILNSYEVLILTKERGKAPFNSMK